MERYYVKVEAPAGHRHPALVSRLVSEVLGGHRPVQLQLRGKKHMRFHREKIFTVTMNDKAVSHIERLAEPYLAIGDRPLLTWGSGDLRLEMDLVPFKEVVRGVIGYGKYQQTLNAVSSSTPVTRGATIEDEEEQL